MFDYISNGGENVFLCFCLIVVAALLDIVMLVQFGEKIPQLLTPTVATGVFAYMRGRKEQT